jgi:hypothetical protein
MRYFVVDAVVYLGSLLERKRNWRPRGLSVFLQAPHAGLPPAQRGAGPLFSEKRDIKETSEFSFS